MENQSRRDVKIPVHSVKMCETRRRINEHGFQKVWFKMALELANISEKTLSVNIFYTVFTHNSSPYTRIMAIYCLTSCSFSMSSVLSSDITRTYLDEFLHRHFGNNPKLDLSSLTA